MRRSFITLVTLSLLTAAVAVAADATKYGTPLTLQDATKVSAILAQPKDYNGKRVRVEGPIVGVCEARGCWIAIGSDQEFQSLRFKVDDGVIVFPMSIKGKMAAVEGVVDVQELSVQAQIEQGQHQAKEHGTTFDPSTVKGPKTAIMLKGEGAEVY